MIRKILGLRIKELRKKRGFSQERLAELSNLNRTYINGVENGKRNISIVNIEKIAKAFQIEIYKLFIKGDE